MPAADLINPAAYVRFIRLAFGKLNEPAPLNLYPDYDDYWKKRQAEGRAPGLLYRYKKIAELLPPSSRILDIGCGDGAFGAHLAIARPDCQYLGLDISQVSVGHAIERGVPCQVIDPGRPLREQVSGDFDCVSLMEVLEHVHDAEELFAQALAFQPNHVFVTIPNVGSIVHRIRLAVFGRFPVTTIIYHMKEHIRFWTFKDFRQWAATFNLRIVSFHGQTGVGHEIADGLALRFPKLFALQVIYVLEAANGNPEK